MVVNVSSHYMVSVRKHKLHNKVPTDIPFYLLFNNSKQINTQQNDAEDIRWHPIKEMISKGESWSSKTEFKGWHSFFCLFLCTFGLVAWSFPVRCPKFSDSKGLMRRHESGRTAAAGLMEPAERILDTRPETASKWKSATCRERNVNMTCCSLDWD